VWNGDIEPVGQLEEVWVQITGVPPKWCDWTTINEIASSLGKPGEIDWQTLFSSFFSQIRVKISCKDPGMIPESRIMEMENSLYMIHFKVENYDKEAPNSPRSDGKGDDSDEDDGNPEDDPKEKQDPGGENEKDKAPNSKTRTPKENGKKEMAQGGQGTLQKTNSVSRALFLAEENEGQLIPRSEGGIPGCMSLLRAMELEESEEEDQTEKTEEEDSYFLPEEWIYSTEVSKETGEAPQAQKSSVEVGELLEEDKSRANRKNRTRKEKEWGPVVVQRRSKRLAGDSKTVIEKAQEVKRKWNEDPSTGMTTSKSYQINFDDLKLSAVVVGIVGKDGNPIKDAIINDMVAVEEKRALSYMSKCDHESCRAVDENPRSCVQGSAIGDSVNNSSDIVGCNFTKSRVSHRSKNKTRS
jgi:hypothetical protein